MRYRIDTERVDLFDSNIVITMTVALDREVTEEAAKAAFTKACSLHVEDIFAPCCQVIPALRNERCLADLSVRNYVSKFSIKFDEIDSVIAGGRFVMRGRRVEGEEEILKEARKVLKQII